MGGLKARRTSGKPR